MSRVCISRISSKLNVPFGNLKCSNHVLAAELLGETATSVNLDGKMAAWQIHAYGDLSELQFSRKARIPHITSPNEVLVKVQAASVNPLDVAMCHGYGRSLLNLFRSSNTIEFPLVLGRDFSGTVVNKGLGVGSKFSIGDPVWGVVQPALQGCHTQFVLVDKNSLTIRPQKLTYVEAASILYTGLTAYSGLMYSSGMIISGMKEKRVLVLGAAGGVGTMAVQILKAGGATVVGSCSSDALTLVNNLGVDFVLDRKASDYAKKVVELGPYDTILDCAGLGSAYASAYKWKYKKFVTFTTPLLRNLDESGVIGGIYKSAQSLAGSAISSFRDGKSTRWAFIIPTAKGIRHLKDLVMRDQLKPVINKVFKLENTPEAYKAMMAGHLRGKIVIDVAGVDSTIVNVISNEQSSNNETAI